MAGERTYTVADYVIDGVSDTLVIRRMTARDWAGFIARYDRLRTTTDKRLEVPQGPDVSPESIAAWAATRRAIADAQESENADNLTFAEQAITAWIERHGPVSGAELWERSFTRPDVWGALLMRIWAEHALSPEQKKRLLSRSGSTPISGVPASTTVGNAPGSTADGAWQSAYAEAEAAMVAK